MMPTLSSLAALEVVIMTTSSGASDDKVGIMTTLSFQCDLTHWGWVMHICVSKITNIGSDNGSSAGGHQAIIWANVGILLIWPSGTNVSEIFITVFISSFKKMLLKMSSVKWRPFCLGLIVRWHIWHHDNSQFECDFRTMWSFSYSVVNKVRWYFLIWNINDLLPAFDSSFINLSSV